MLERALTTQVCSAIVSFLLRKRGWTISRIARVIDSSADYVRRIQNREQSFQMNDVELLAKAQRRSRSFIAAEAIRQYVAVNEWQIEEISKGMAEADRGEFASDEQVRHTMNKWTGRKPTRRAK